MSRWRAGIRRVVDRAARRLGVNPPGPPESFLAADGPFLEQITTRKMWARYEEMYQTHADIRLLDWILGRPKVLEWVHSAGVSQDATLRSLVPSIPPVELRETTAEPDLPIYLWTGIVDARQMIGLYEGSRGALPSRVPAILDFGCGNGRLMRFLEGRIDKWSVHGCDVNPAQIGWCKHNLRVQAAQIATAPPTSYESQKFDFIFCLSVFTHLPEVRARDWLCELHRILAPGGILVVTTHGLTALETIRRSTAHQRMFQLTEAAVEEVLGNFAEKRFRFFRYDRRTLGLADAGDDYGSTFVHPAYTREIWAGEKLELLQHLPGGLRGWQDIVVMRRRPEAPQWVESPKPASASVDRRR